MDRSAVLQTLKAAESELRSHGIAHVAVFGSVARGEATPGSDIDIMVEIAPDASERMGVYEYVGLVRTIQEMFPLPVEVSDRAALKTRVRPDVEHDAVYAF